MSTQHDALVRPMSRRDPSRLASAARRLFVRVEELEPRLLLDGSFQGSSVRGLLLEPAAAASPLNAATATVEVLDMTAGLSPDPTTLPAASSSATLDTTAPHDTVDTAQALPADTDVELTGPLAPNGSGQVVRIPLQPGVDAVTLAFTWTGPADASSADLSLLDGSGRTVIDQPVSGQAPSTALYLWGVTAPSGTSLYVRISATGPPIASSSASSMVPASLGFSLRVTQDTSGNGSPPQFVCPETPSGTDARSLVATSTTITVPVANTTQTPLPSGNAQQTPPTVNHQDFGSDGSTGPHTPLPLPLSIAAPVAGIFADGGSVVPPTRTEAAAVDLALIALPLRSPAYPSSAENLAPLGPVAMVITTNEPNAPPSSPAPAPLAAWLLPTIVTSPRQAQAGWSLRTQPLTPASDDAESSTAELPAIAPVAVMVAAVPAETAAESPVQQKARPSPMKRVSLLAGLCASVTFTCGFAGPELVASLRNARRARATKKALPRGA